MVISVEFQKVPLTIHKNTLGYILKDTISFKIEILLVFRFKNSDVFEQSRTGFILDVLSLDLKLLSVKTTIGCKVIYHTILKASAYHISFRKLSL